MDRVVNPITEIALIRLQHDQQHSWNTDPSQLQTSETANDSFLWWVSVGTLCGYESDTLCIGLTNIYLLKVSFTSLNKNL